VKPGDKVVVFGCGPIGLGMVLWLVDRGITDVVALDLAPERLERARALGARADRALF
jgi:threonine dehydrogenase-like Zn-dependent dehydrogenase